MHDAALRYDIVVATRNRLDALRMSVPLLLGQTILPERIVVVDASDDFDAISKGVAELTADTSVEIVVVKSEKRNLAHQRNTGLRHVRSPVTFFPDDDSLWYPDFAEKVLRVYARDEEGVVAGVSGTETLVSPLHEGAETYARNKPALLKARIQPWRNRIESVFFPKPFERFAQDLVKARKVPGWIEGPYKLVETIGGYRMSFRTDVVREAAGFDEVLGYGVGYSLHEDMEMSLRLQSRGYLLAATSEARVFHHVYPGARASGFSYGFCHIANYGYVCRKLMRNEDATRATVYRYLRYKTALYGVRFTKSHGRQVFRGGWSAYRNLRSIMNARPSELADLYRRLCDENIG